VEDVAGSRHGTPVQLAPAAARDVLGQRAAELRDGTQ